MFCLNILVHWKLAESWDKIAARKGDSNDDVGDMQVSYFSLSMLIMKSSILFNLYTTYFQVSLLFPNFS